MPRRARRMKRSYIGRYIRAGCRHRSRARRITVHGTLLTPARPASATARRSRASRSTRWCSSSACSTPRAPCSRSTRSRSTPSASSSPTSKASRSGRPSGGRSPTEINQGIRDAIARAARASSSAGTRRSIGRAGGTETIIIDASLMPVIDDDGKVVFICAEGRDITEKKAQEREIARRTSSCEAARAHPRARRDQDAVLRQRQPRAAHAADAHDGATGGHARRAPPAGPAARARAPQLAAPLEADVRRLLEVSYQVEAVPRVRAPPLNQAVLSETKLQGHRDRAVGQEGSRRVIVHRDVRLVSSRHERSPCRLDASAQLGRSHPSPGVTIEPGCGCHRDKAKEDHEKHFQPDHVLPSRRAPWTSIASSVTRRPVPAYVSHMMSRPQRRDGRPHG